MYVRDVVEAVEPFAPEDPVVNTVMEALFNAKVTCPVLLENLKAVKLSAAIKKIPRLYARLLVTLNGSGLPLVSPAKLKEAAGRENAIRGTTAGWGSAEAFDHVGYTSGLLLKSVGVSEDVLPPIKSVPSSVKSQIDAAFKRACLYFGW